MTRLLLLLFAFFLLADAARAQTCVVQTNGDCMLQPSAAEGQDVSPYCFIPGLQRGQEPTNYAFTANDDDGLCHNFETYLRFALPADLLGPGETVTTARLLLYYAFTFAFEGPPPTLPHAPTTVRVHEALSFWNEDTVTWGTRPSFAPTAAATLGGITNLGVKEFIITDLVRAWAHGTKPNRGVAVVSPNDIPFGMNSWEADDELVPVFQKARLRITVAPGSSPVPAFPY